MKNKKMQMAKDLVITMRAFARDRQYAIATGLFTEDEINNLLIMSATKFGDHFANMRVEELEKDMKVSMLYNLTKFIEGDE